MNDIPPGELIEMMWAARNASVDALNAERLASFNARKAAIGERDLPPSIIHQPAANVTKLPSKQQQGRKP